MVAERSVCEFWFREKRDLAFLNDNSSNYGPPFGPQRGDTRMTVYEQLYGPLTTGVVPDVKPSPVRETAVRSIPFGATSRGMTADMQLARLVRNALEWSPFLDEVNIEVTVANGAVTLAGICPYRSLGRMAQMIAYTVPGVRNVVNEIRIARDPAL